MTFIDKVLYRQVYNQSGQRHYQLVILESHSARALEGVHDATGHMGYERTLDLAHARFYWPHMAAAVETKCKTCERCINFLSLEPDSGDVRNILVITEHFT